jgi:hypothetical protein
LALARELITETFLRFAHVLGTAVGGYSGPAMSWAYSSARLATVA